ncbi:hypothetical protein ACQ4LE_009109 [Meloidogyne hapla]|uniref:Uncharacterized protein n=1 Tax=Meloidogyne hapla TaxID=6305 RepID=A0A1I8BMV4_MELHA
MNSYLIIILFIILSINFIFGQGPPPKEGIKIIENENNKDEIENIGKKMLNAAAKKLSTLNTEVIEKKITKALGLNSSEND